MNWDKGAGQQLPVGPRALRAGEAGMLDSPPPPMTPGLHPRLGRLNTASPKYVQLNILHK